MQVFLLNIEDQIVSWVDLWGGGINLRTWKPGAWKVALFRVCSADRCCKISWVPAPKSLKKGKGTWVSSKFPRWFSCFHHFENHWYRLRFWPLGYLWLCLLRCYCLNHRGSLLSWHNGRKASCGSCDSVGPSALMCCASQGRPCMLQSGNILAVVISRIDE